MKKILVMIVFTLLLCACQPQDNNVQNADNHMTNDQNSQQNQDSNIEDDVNQKILIAYFSRVGVTDFEDDVDTTSSASINIIDDTMLGNSQIVAQEIQNQTHGDLFQIITDKKYPSDYRETTNVAREEQNNEEIPSLSTHVENFEQYSTVILVYPNWWGTLPMPVRSFLEEYDFSQKTILPVVTHGGSALGRSDNDIQNLCPDTVLKEGLAISGSEVSDSAQEIQTWLAKVLP